MTDKVCTVPPSGWACKRDAGHDGPCAAVPVVDYFSLLHMVEGDDFYGELVHSVVKHHINIGAKQRGLRYDDANDLFELENKDEFASCDHNTYLAQALDFAGVTGVDATKMADKLFEQAEIISSEIKKMLSYPQG